MDDIHKPSRSRAKSSPEFVERLERSRDRILARRAATREKEKVVTAAVKRYIGVWQTIGAVERRRDSEIARLQQRIVEVRDAAEMEIAEHRTEQAVAAAVIRDQGHDADDIADLLEITPKQVRQLLSAARDAAAIGAQSAESAERDKQSDVRTTARDNGRADNGKDQQLSKPNPGSPPTVVNNRQPNSLAPEPK
ncbi:hypothetical protein [Nocardia sp. CA-135398]|uniref:hypothetical protein n=1 Tax=Nocardia sp. CA-135398 TaxID=3239977 RepID=UPI003D984BBC